MPKYNKRIVEKICEIIAEDDYTVVEICAMVGIHEATYYQWKLDHAEFSEALKKAHEKRLDTFRKAARVGMMTLLQGKTWEEVTSEYKRDKKGTPELVYQKKVKKTILPNPAMVIFVTKNLDSDNFSDTFLQQHSGPDGQPIASETKHTVVFKKYDSSQETSGEAETEGSQHQS